MRIILLFISLVAFAAAAQPALALGVTPLVLELRSAGESRSAQIVVNNDATADTPIELAIFRVEMDESGEQHSTPASSDFIIFPPMRLIPPHGKQVFKIQWAGAPLAKSQTYSFFVLQPHVKMPGAQSGVQIEFQFQVLVYVAPPSGTRTLDLRSSSVTAVSGKRYASLVVSNSGNVHAFLGDATVTLHSGAWSRTLLPGDIQKLIGLGTVQPGKSRRFTVPVEVPPEAGSLAAQISYNGAFH
jgi:P pilus assembly chaperone PapD